METVGIRELRAHLSRHLERVRSGARLVITECGRAIATLNPVQAPPDVDWAQRLVAEGRAQWNGSKPSVAMRSARLTGNRAASMVLENRR